MKFYRILKGINEDDVTKWVREEISFIEWLKDRFGILLICLMLMLTGCLNGNLNHAFDFNNTYNTNALCSVKCADLMQEHHCASSYPSFQYNDFNGDTETKCSCAIIQCKY